MFIKFRIQIFWTNCRWFWLQRSYLVLALLYKYIGNWEKSRNLCVAYLEDLLIDLVAVVETEGLAGGAGIKIGEACTSGEDPDGLSNVSDGSTGMTGGCPVFVVLDLKTIVRYY